MKNKLRKSIALLLSVAFIVGIMPMYERTIKAETDSEDSEEGTIVVVEKPLGPTSGTCGENVQWELDTETGVLSIYGSGKMYDYDNNYNNYLWARYEELVPWYFRRESITKIEISSGITAIGSSVFEDCENLTSVTIPDSVTSIGDFAFSLCFSLENITIPDSITSIGEAAFWKCSSFTEVIIPDGVTKISNSAFQDCTSLTNIIIPNSVTSIENYAFFYCTSLVNITIPNSVRSIGKGAFGHSYNLTNITIPDGVTSIEDETFERCESLANITIPNSVRSIGKGAFEECSSLTEIVIPNGVISIGDWAFWECSSLTKVIIPNSVISIGDVAFGGNKLENIYYCGTKSDWAKVSIEADSNSTLLSVLKFHEQHTYDGDITIIKEPTCTETGIQVRACSICGKTETQTIAKLAHKYIDTVVQPTYTEQGYTLHKCSICGYSYKDSYTAKKTSENRTNTTFDNTTKPSNVVTAKPAKVKFSLRAGKKKVTIKWNKVKGASGYTVYYKTTKKGKWKKLKNVSAKKLNYVKKKLKSGKKYYFTVKAYKKVNGKKVYGKFTTKKIKVK